MSHQSTNQKCFNGKQLNFYQLQNLLETQTYWTKLKQPFFSVFEAGITRDKKLGTIKRIDNFLATYLRKVSKLENVITIIVSVHGNLLDRDFILRSYPEGAIDRWNPFLFTIFPKNLEIFFTPDELRALQFNQHKLVTVMDLHFFIVKLAGEIPKIGESFSPIQNSSGLTKNLQIRSCENINDHFFDKEAIQDLCICEKEELKVSNFDLEIVRQKSEDFLNMQIPRSALQSCRSYEIDRLTNNSIFKYQRDIDKVVLLTRVEMKDYIFKKSKVIFTSYVEFNEQTQDYKVLAAFRIDDYSRFHHCWARTPWVELYFCICGRNEYHKYNRNESGIIV